MTATATCPNHKQAARNNPSLFTTDFANNHLPVPRVFANDEEDANKERSQTRSMTLHTQPLPRVSAPQVSGPVAVFPPSIRKSSKRWAETRYPVAADVPASNTRAHTAEASRHMAPIATGTRSSKIE